MRLRKWLKVQRALLHDAPQIAASAAFFPYSPGVFLQSVQTNAKFPSTVKSFLVDTERQGLFTEGSTLANTH